MPDIVHDYLRVTAADAIAEGMPPWRDTVRSQVAATWAFLVEALSLDEDPVTLDLPSGTTLSVR